MRDEEIIDLYWSRNEQAIKETDSAYGKRLLAQSMHIVHDMFSSQECVQDTYLKAWNSMPPQRPRFLFAYLAKIVRNDSINVLRLRSAEKRTGDQYPANIDELAEILSDEHGPHEDVYWNDQISRIDIYNRSAYNSRQAMQNSTYLLVQV